MPEERPQLAYRSDLEGLAAIPHKGLHLAFSIIAVVALFAPAEPGPMTHSLAWELLRVWNQSSRKLSFEAVSIIGVMSPLLLVPPFVFICLVLSRRSGVQPGIRIACWIVTVGCLIGPACYWSVHPITREAHLLAFSAAGWLAWCVVGLWGVRCALRVRLYQHAPMMGLLTTYVADVSMFIFIIKVQLLSSPAMILFALAAALAGVLLILLTRGSIPEKHRLT
jgi:hypothetical protein